MDFRKSGVHGLSVPDTSFNLYPILNLNQLFFDWVSCYGQAIRLSYLYAYALVSCFAYVIFVLEIDLRIFLIYVLVICLFQLLSNRLVLALFGLYEMHILCVRGARQGYTDSSR